MIITIAIAAAAFAAGWLAHPPAPPRPPAPPPRSGRRAINVQAACDLIQSAAATARLLTKADDMLTAAECGTEIRASWGEQSYKLTVSRGLALVERNKLRAALLRDIDTLCDMRVDGITQSVTQSHSEARHE